MFIFIYSLICVVIVIVLIIYCRSCVSLVVIICRLVSILIACSPLYIIGSIYLLVIVCHLVSVIFCLFISLIVLSYSYIISFMPAPIRFVSLNAIAVFSWTGLSMEVEAVG